MRAIKSSLPWRALAFSAIVLALIAARFRPQSSAHGKGSESHGAAHVNKRGHVSYSDYKNAKISWSSLDDYVLGEKIGRFADSGNGRTNGAQDEAGIPRCFKPCTYPATKAG